MTNTTKSKEQEQQLSRHPELQKSPETKSRTARTLGFFLQMLLFGALALLLMEAVFNFAGVGNEEFLEPDPVFGVRHIANKKVVWRLEGYSDETLSSQGLRDTEHSIQKPDSVYRIALLGDSATEGLQVPLNQTYGKVLERMLNESKQLGGKKAEVINFGCSSYSNGQEVFQLENQVAAYKPDLVIMMYNRGDYIENIRDPSTMKAEPRPYFHMDESGKNLLQDNTIMEFNKKSFEPNQMLDFLRRHSRIYGVLTHTNLALSLNEQLYSKMRNSILKLLPGTKDGFKRVVPPYQIKDPWLVTEALIDRANKDCKAMNSEFMLVCFPNHVNDAEYGRQIANLNTLGNKECFPFLDLSEGFLSNSEKGLFLKYHFSEAGHKLTARSIADKLK